MDIIVHPAKLRGDVVVSGNKNAALPVLAASILVPGKVTLKNIPNITDVNLFLDFYKSLNVGVKYNPRLEILHLDFSSLKGKNTLVIENPGKLGRIRASILLLSGLMARFKKVRFMSSIEGCSLGLRPLLVHFETLRKLGIKVRQTSSFIELDATTFDKTTDKFLWLPERSVTATEISLILATLRKAKTTIYNAASEPHVQDTALFLKKLGFKINGIGTDKVTIVPNGKKERNNVTFTIYSDHHEIATWLITSVVTRSKFGVIHNLDPMLLTPIQRTLLKFGIDLRTQELNKQQLKKIYAKSAFQVRVNPKHNGKVYRTTVTSTKILPDKEELSQRSMLEIKAHPWPGLPVDILSIYVPLAAYSTSPVLFHNWMYDGGLFWTLELRKAGVNVTMADPHRVIIHKGQQLKPARLEAPYIIRATIALTIFAASLQGPSTIRKAETILRGHPYFLEKYANLGGRIEQMS